MTDRPIIFSAPMVRALLDGRKTQTRRILKPQPPAEVVNVRGPYPFEARIDGDAAAGNAIWFSNLRFSFGDRLWVRESFAMATPVMGIGKTPCYKATEGEINKLPDGSYPWKWTPSIHMPRWASRITLHVTGVKVERVQDISEADAQAEGATCKPRCCGYSNLYDGWSMNWKEPAADYALVSAAMAFGSFINELHGGPRWSSKPGPSLWDSNPWVVAVTFRVVKANIDSPAFAPDGASAGKPEERA